MTVLIDGAEFLRQNSFAINGGHSKECGQPHPEDSAGTAGHQCGGTTGDITGADLSSDGGCQRLEGGHAFVVCFFAVKRESAEQLTHAGAEFPNLYKTGADGKNDTGTDEQE